MERNLLVILVVCCIFLGGEISTSFAGTPQTWGAIDSPSGLTLRKTPGKSGKKIATIPDKTVVEILSMDGKPYEVIENRFSSRYEIKVNQKTLCPQRTVRVLTDHFCEPPLAGKFLVIGTSF